MYTSNKARARARIDEAIMQLISDPEYRPIRQEWLKDDVSSADVGIAVLKYSHELISRNNISADVLAEIVSHLDDAVLMNGDEVTRGLRKEVVDAIDLSIKRQESDGFGVDVAKREFMLQYILNARLSGRASDVGSVRERMEHIEAASDLYDRAIDKTKKGG